MSKPAQYPLFLLVAMLCAGCAQAPRAASIAPQEFNYEKLLGGPPADDSAEHRAEVATMLRLQNQRTPEDVKRCQSEEIVTVFAFSTVLGDGFNAKEMPYTAALMQDVYDRAKRVSDEAKRHWSRVRPPIADPRIKPCVKFESSPSFPSGHATRGMAWAILLADLFPEQRDALLARGRQIGDDRFMAGMHYPTDVRAGQKLGEEIGRRLLADPQFTARLERVKEEFLAHSHV